MRVIITAGGTGGHIYPALAILNKIRDQEPDSTFLYIGTTNRMEKDLVPKKNIPYKGIPMMGLNRKKPWKNVAVLKTYLQAVRTAKEEIEKFKPDVVIGVGGYITAPVLYAAHKLGCKTVIHEQNAIPGVSNKFLSRYVDLILVSFKESLSFFPKKKAIYTGNPRSEEVLGLEKGKKDELDFSSKLPMVLFAMGSLGSMTMTKKMKELIPSFANKKYQVLLATGKDYFDDYKDVKVPKNVKLVPNYDAKYMKTSELMVCRSGASTIAEITALGLPTIFVPSPYVTHNHQMKNALTLEQKGACKILPEENFSKETLLPLIDEILFEKEVYQEMKKNLQSFKVADSATKIYQQVVKLVRNEK